MLLADLLGPFEFWHEGAAAVLLISLTNGNWTHDYVDHSRKKNDAAN